MKIVRPVILNSGNFNLIIDKSLDLKEGSLCREKYNYFMIQGKNSSSNCFFYLIISMGNDNLILIRFVGYSKDI